MFLQRPSTIPGKPPARGRGWKWAWEQTGTGAWPDGVYDLGWPRGKVSSDGSLEKLHWGPKFLILHLSHGALEGSDESYRPPDSTPQGSMHTLASAQFARAQRLDEAYSPTSHLGQETGLQTSPCQTLYYLVPQKEILIKTFFQTPLWVWFCFFDNCFFSLWLIYHLIKHSGP